MLHSNLCDFHSTPSLGNKKYVITFIDNYSKFCYVYLLHAKDEALNSFKINKNEVELQVRCKLKRLKTDNEGGNNDASYFQSMSIIHETTERYAP